jgi:thymidylate kinase
MIKAFAPGLFIDIEGLDGSGKTTCLKNAVEMLKDWDIICLKAVGSDTFLGRLARKMGHRKSGTFFFLLETLFITWFPLRKALDDGKIVLMDKYFFNVASHVPEVNTLLNKMLIKILGNLIFEPDLIFFFTVSLPERIRRLKAGPENRFHQRLIANPGWIIERENAYKGIVYDSGVKVIRIDTTELDIRNTAERLHDSIINYIFSGAL